MAATLVVTVLLLPIDPLELVNADELLVIGYNEAKALIIPAAAADALLGRPLLPTEPFIELLPPADEFGGPPGPPGGPYNPDMAPGPNRPKAAAL